MGCLVWFVAMFAGSPGLAEALKTKALGGFRV